MLGKIFSVLILLSAAHGALLGRMDALGPALLSGASKAVSVTLSTLGVMSLWSGVLAVIRESGGLARIAGLAKPLLSFLFPTTARTGRGLDAAVTCLAANLLGLGNAATPAGIDALKKMQEGSDRPGIAAHDASMLISLNAASFSVFPATVIALRQAAGAQILLELLPAVWASGLAGTLTAIVSVKVIGFIAGRHRSGLQVRAAAKRRIV